jgi:hypothetical protein
MEFLIEWSWRHFQSIDPFRGKQQIILTYLFYGDYADSGRISQCDMKKHMLWIAFWLRA